EVLRLAMLMTHYREPIDFSVRRLEEAENKLIAWYRAMALPDPDTEIDLMFLDALRDDLDLSSAFSRLDFLKSEINATGGLISIEKKRTFTASVRLMGVLIEPNFDTFMNQYAKATIQLTDAEIQHFSDQRLAFIAAKNWAEADRIRDELLAQGIQLKDGKDPETGARVTSWEVRR
ncbi:MAG: hypothetical protein VR78_12300, partial [Hoeflea sp. BRH_c9]